MDSLFLLQFFKKYDKMSAWKAYGGTAHAFHTFGTPPYPFAPYTCFWHVEYAEGFFMFKDKEIVELLKEINSKLGVISAILKNSKLKNGGRKDV